MAQEKRIRALEEDVQAHSGAALWLFMENAKRRPQQRPHLVPLLEDTPPQMPPKTAAPTRTLVAELHKT